MADEDGENLLSVGLRQTSDTLLHALRQVDLLQSDVHGKVRGTRNKKDPRN